MPSLKFFTELPRPLASCGKRFAPKISTTMTRMMSSSGRPSVPNMLILQRIRGSGIALIVPPFVACAVAIGSTVRAQFASGVNLVEVYATVTDQQGRLAEGLTAADFRVSEDGVPQTIAAFAAGGFPLS